MRNYHSFISGIIKFLLIGYLLIVFPVVLIAQWQYVKKIADSCTPSISNNYSFYEWQVGNHGGGYAVTRNGSVILTNEGSFGCCWVRALEPFTDSIVIFVQASKYPDQCSITVNEGNTWNCIDSWYDIYIQDWIFVNKNTCYFISKGYNWDGSRISIRRVSDIKSRYLIKNDSIDPAISIVELHDTIFGDPYCHDMDTIGFRILNDSIYIDFYIYLTTVPLAFNENSSSPIVKVFPNPVIEELTIESKQGTKLIISDLMGRHMMEKKISSSKAKINLSILQPGIYFLNFFNSNNSHNSMKIIKQ